MTQTGCKRNELEEVAHDRNAYDLQINALLESVESLLSTVSASRSYLGICVIAQSDNTNGFLADFAWPVAVMAFSTNCSAHERTNPVSDHCGCCVDTAHSGRDL